AALRAKLDAAVVAAGQAQAAADEQLYKSNQAVRAACDALARVSRFDLVGEALLRPGTGLLARVGRDAKVIGFAFADELAPVPLAVARDERPATGPSTAPATLPTTIAHPETSLAVAPDGRRSDIGGAVRRALELFEGREVAAVAVSSDGRQGGGEGAVTSGLGWGGTRVCG